MFGITILECTPLFLVLPRKNNDSEGSGFPVTRWLTVSSAYPLAYCMTFRTEFNGSTALWDTIIDCQDLYAEQKINHLVTGRTWPTTIVREL